MILCKKDSDNCILALRNNITEYKRLEDQSKEEFLKKEFKLMRLSMEETLKALEKEYGE